MLLKTCTSKSSGNRAGSTATGVGGAQTCVCTAVAAPFGPGDTKLIYEGSGQLTTVAFSYDGKTMFVSDSGAVIAIRTSDPSKRYNLGRGVTVATGGGGRGAGGGGGGAGADSAANAGALATKRGPNGPPVVLWAFWATASSDAAMPKVVIAR